MTNGSATPVQNADIEPQEVVVRYSLGKREFLAESHRRVRSGRLWRIYRKAVVAGFVLVMVAAYGIESLFAEYLNQVIGETARYAAMGAGLLMYMCVFGFGPRLVLHVIFQEDWRVFHAWGAQVAVQVTSGGLTWSIGPRTTSLAWPGVDRVVELADRFDVVWAQDRIQGIPVLELSEDEITMIRQIVRRAGVELHVRHRVQHRTNDTPADEGTAPTCGRAADR